MSSSKQMDEYLEKAFGLAYFIQGSRERAVSIVREALGKLEVAASAQVKRLYYSPARRAKASRPAWRTATQRTKVSLSEIHLLQRLIYIESERYEKEQEHAKGAAGPTVETMLIHFIKHLVRITLKRNSFYVTLGVSRLLHNYSTAETMEIYNVAVQDPERVKDDYYYRSRKSRLIHETRERFGEFLTVSRGPRGEERFKTRTDSHEYVSLVEECLNRFSPWDTECPVPDSFDPLTDELEALSCAERDEEDRIEINRIHAILHPACYSRITKALRIEPPELRLDIPYFSLKNGDNDMNSHDRPSRRSTPQPLSRDELETIKTALADESARRSTTHAGLLSILVDGLERATLDLKRTATIDFAIEEGDELVEVRGLSEGRDVLLAAHLIKARGEAARRPVSSEIVLEGGQKLSFLMTPVEGNSDAAAQYKMAIAYRETRWLAAAYLFAERTAQRLCDRYGYDIRLERAVLRFAFASVALLLCAGALALLIVKRPSRTSQVREAAQQVSRPAATVRPRVNAPQMPEGVKMLSHGSGGAQESPASQTVSEPEETNKQAQPEKIERQDGNGNSPSKERHRTLKRRRK